MYLIMVASYVIAPRASPWALMFHRRLASYSYQTSLDTSDFPLGAIIATNLMLNATFFTIVCLLTLRDILDSVPMLKIVEGLVPAISPLLLSSTGNFLFAAFFVAFPGPALVFGVRRLRKNDINRGKNVFEFLQVLFYVSLLLVILVWHSGTAPSGIKIEGYARMFMDLFLPGNLGGGALLVLMSGDSSLARKPKTRKSPLGSYASDSFETKHG
jgi:hypothetical protein